MDHFAQHRWLAVRSAAFAAGCVGVLIALAIWVATPARTAAGEACTACDLGKIARERAGAGATDCGWLRRWDPTDSIVACALEQARGQGRFFAIFSRQGIDSVVREAWVRGPSGKLERLNYDSDPSGGMGCNPVVRASTCASVPAAGRAALECKRNEDLVTLCR